MGQGGFLVLSLRPSADAALFEPPEVSEFAPDLQAGDRLAFVLRTNAPPARPPSGRAAGDPGGAAPRADFRGS